MASKNESNTGGALNEIQLIQEWRRLCRLARENGEQHENGASQSDAHGGNNDGTGDNTDPEDEDNTAASGNESTGRMRERTGMQEPMPARRVITTMITRSRPTTATVTRDHVLDPSAISQQVGPPSPPLKIQTHLNIDGCREAE
jgi:hypothetical protein